MKSNTLPKSAIAERTMPGQAALSAVGRGARGKAAIDDADNDYLRWWQRRAETPSAPVPVVIRVPRLSWCPQGWRR